MPGQTIGVNIHRTVSVPTTEDVLAHVAAITRLHRPDVPAWIEAQDLTFGQLRLLFRLSHTGPTPMSQIAAWLGVSMATATGIVERVERRGLVDRRHRDDDRRVVECCVTEQGEQLVAEIDGLRIDSTRKVLAALDDAERAEFDRLLRLIIERTREQNG